MLKEPLRVGVVGAGAIGGYLAGKLALAGHEISVLARGEHLDAMRKGLTLAERRGGSVTATFSLATDRIIDLGPQDYLIIALKAHQLAEVAPALASCYTEETTVVTLQNGIPWWYFHKHGGPYEGYQFTSLDPEGLLTRSIPDDRVVGCVVHKAARLNGPGLLEYTDAPGDSFPLGELDGTESSRLRRLAQALEAAGVHAPVIPDIRAEKWYKLWGNLVFNPICALTHANCQEAHDLKETYQLGITLMEEIREVAEKLGVRFRASPQDRMARTYSAGPIQPSMLQDTEAGRPLEVDAMLGAVIELGHLTGTAMPHVETIHACAKLLASVIARHRVRITPKSREAAASTRASCTPLS